MDQVVFLSDTKLRYKAQNNHGATGENGMWEKVGQNEKKKPISPLPDKALLTYTLSPLPKLLISSSVEM